MIHNALKFLKDEINHYLSTKINDNVDKLILSNVVEQNGELKITELGMSLVNVEEERVNKSQSPYTVSEEGGKKVIKRGNPEIKLNLYLLFTAYFGSNDEEALKFLSYVIEYFQARQVFRPEDFPALNGGIEKLIVELVSLNFEEQSRLWGTLGAKYMPSVLYKVRMLTVQDVEAMHEVEVVESIEPKLRKIS